MNASVSTAPARRTPSLAHRLRKRLGRMKCVVLDQWPYIPLVRAGATRREENRPMLQRLPAIPPSAAFLHEVHMLCGHRDADMGVWASWSLLRHLPATALWVHSDGTLSAPDMALWRRAVGPVHFTEPAERAVRAQALQSRYPTLHRWRSCQLYAPKFIDFHLYGEADRFLMLDSDVLCLARPDEVLEAMACPVPVQRWNSDHTSSYSASPELLKSLLGVEVPERLNAGFMLTRRWTPDDWQYFDHCLTVLARAGVPVEDRWAEQMLYAISAGRTSGSRSFSAGYNITFGRTSAASVVRHYVGVPRVRPRFHTEGVTRLIDEAAAAPRSPLHRLG